MSVADFILARLAEDEATARETHSDALAFESTPPYAKLGFAAGRLAARHDPARVLRQVEAMRRVVGPHGPDDYYGCALCATGDSCGCCPPSPDDYANGCPTLRTLAGIWSDHADYDPAWRI